MFPPPPNWSMCENMAAYIASSGLLRDDPTSLKLLDYNPLSNQGPCEVNSLVKCPHMSFQFTIRYQISDIGNHNKNQKKIFFFEKKKFLECHVLSRN